MNSYNSIQQLRKAHTNGDFVAHNHITVGETVYTLQGTTHSLNEVFHDSTNCALVYTNESGDQTFAVIWGKNKQQLAPVDVKTFTGQAINEEENKIGDTVTVEFLNIPTANTLRGTVDTGATYNSLHADKWEIKGDQVHFVCKPLSQDSVIRIPLETQQAVKSPGDDVEYRPVVSLNIMIGDKRLDEQLFNLSDRGDMENPVLIGQNTLEDGNFLIDPKLNEHHIDWDMIRHQINQVTVDHNIVSETTSSISSASPEEIRNVYETLRNSNVTLEDIFKVMHADIISEADQISY